MREIKNANIWRFDKEIRDWFSLSNKLIKKFNDNAYTKLKTRELTDITKQEFFTLKSSVSHLIGMAHLILTKYDNIINDRPVLAQEPADYIVILDEEDEE